MIIKNEVEAREASEGVRVSQSKFTSYQTKSHKKKAGEEVFSFQVLQ